MPLQRDYPSPSHYQTLSDLIERLQSRGYSLTFTPAEGRIFCFETKEAFQPSDLAINEVYRFEGASDPEDMAVVYGIETSSGERGTIVDAFGTYGDPQLGELIKSIPYKAGRE
ncbi:MAG: phosphoribosylpyrophosphate synthetase [Deltaproteobacteria bacterium]|nr:phosphoribosylpyrophosphate synthetase [Deltaproteobacteria bacterium]